MRLAAQALAVLALLLAPSAARARDVWERTIEQVSPGVVALRVTGTRAFDTEGPGVSAATGFVVDAERGLILTNRHVVRPGPVTAEAVFLNHERVRVWPVYRDPVHDFGFFRYDPKSVRFLTPPSLTLAPAAARVGAEIRVIGNDAGEKLSILAGTLARLDREAPSYGRGNYSDFDTFYLQAASGISGGSSGSPVVDRAGRVIALVAGGSRQAASSFFLPLDRVVYAFSRLQSGAPVARGSVQAVFQHRSYDELERLGFSRETEAALRAAHPTAEGLLAVAEVLPGGPAAGRLEPGDVVLALDGAPLLGFTGLAAVLDAAVGRSVRFEVERSGVRRTVALDVQDLHTLAPSEYLELSGAVLHPLSLQLARSYGVPVAGLVLAGRGYAFGRAGVPSRALLREVDGAPVPDLDALERELVLRADGERVRVRWSDLARPELAQESLLRIDRRWFPARRCARDDAAGRFTCRALAEAPPARAVPPVTTRLAGGGPGPAERLARSLVTVRFDVPYGIDGVHGVAFTGAGLVVDAERGLVLVDRDTVPVALGDVEITFGGAGTLDGRVIALHPEHGLALVGYDPAQLGETPVESAALSSAPLAPGDAVWLVSVGERGQLLARETAVERIDGPNLPLPQVPRFRETNLDLISVTETLPGVGGVLADGKGRVAALWASFLRESENGPRSFFAGIPAELALAWLGETPAGAPPPWRTLGLELGVLPLAEARGRGLPAALADELLAREDGEARVLFVRRVLPGGPAADRLRVGDLLVRVNGRAVTRFREVERAAQAEAVTLTIVRGAAAHDHVLAPLALDGAGTSEALLFAGALLQTPPFELESQWGLLRQGVYVAGSFRGSPAERDALVPTLRILSVGDQPTPDLASFRVALAARAGDETVRLRVVDLEGRTKGLSVGLDLQDWPHVLLRRTPSGWERSEAP